jgi:hypothetical protein
VPIEWIESFTWIDNSAAGKTALNSRYNSPINPLVYNIDVGGGRFTGNALDLSGSSYSINYYGGPFGPDVVFGFAVEWRATTLGQTSALCQLFEQSTGIGNEQVSIRFDTAGHLCICRGATVLATGAQVMQQNAFYYVEFVVHFDPAAGSAEIWINGVLDSSVSGANTQPQATAVTSSFSFGNVSTPLFCDVYAMSGTLVPLGPRRVSLKLATADGFNQDWLPSTGVTQFNLVNTVPPDGDANGFISSAVPGDNSSFGFNGLPYTPLSIDAVQVSLYARFDDAGPHEVATLIRQGGANFIGTTQPIAATYLDLYLQIYETDPATAIAWTPVGVDAAEYGVNLVL